MPRFLANGGYLPIRRLLREILRVEFRHERNCNVKQTMVDLARFQGNADDKYKCRPTG